MGGKQTKSKGKKSSDERLQTAAHEYKYEILQIALDERKTRQ